MSFVDVYVRSILPHLSYIHTVSHERQEYEKQAQLGAKAEAAALAAAQASGAGRSGDLDGFKIEVDQRTVKRARKVCLSDPYRANKQTLDVALKTMRSRFLIGRRQIKVLQSNALRSKCRYMRTLR